MTRSKEQDKKRQAGHSTSTPKDEVEIPQVFPGADTRKGKIKAKNTVGKGKSGKVDTGTNTTDKSSIEPGEEH